MTEPRPAFPMPPHRRRTRMPREVSARMTERELENGVRHILRAVPRVMAYHTYDARRSAEGYPDWTFAGPGGLMFRELKRETGKATPAQQRWLAALSYAGADAAIWRPADLLDGRIAAELVQLARDRYAQQE